MAAGASAGSHVPRWVAAKACVRGGGRGVSRLIRGWEEQQEEQEETGERRVPEPWPYMINVAAGSGGGHWRRCTPKLDQVLATYGPQCSRRRLLTLCIGDFSDKVNSQ